MCFLRKLCQKRTFYDILNRNQLFLEQKIEVLKRPKNGHFLKGLLHEIFPKVELFLIGVFHRNYFRKDRF